jgi:hypothetical protein
MTDAKDKERLISMTSRLRKMLELHGLTPTKNRKPEKVDDYEDYAGWGMRVATWGKERPAVALYLDNTVDSDHFGFWYGFETYEKTEKSNISVLANSLPDLTIERYISSAKNPTMVEIRSILSRILNSGIEVIHEEHPSWDGYFLGKYEPDFSKSDTEILRDAEQFIVEVVEAVEPALEEEADIAAIKNDPNETEKEQLIKARRGQGIFRRDLINERNRCAVTGCGVLLALRASHILPWRKANRDQRLCHFNGLLLAAHLDALFDKHQISFQQDGIISISRHVADDIKDRLQITADMKIDGSLLNKERKYFLRIHHDEFERKQAEQSKR